MLIWALLAKWLNKKEKLKNKNIFIALHVSFFVITAWLGLWLFDFVRNGGEVPAMTRTKMVFNYGIILAAGVYAFFASRKADAKKEKKLFDKDYEWADTIYFSALLASFVMFFFIQAFKIPSASMRNTLLEGDHLFVNKFTYGFRVPLTQIRFLEFNHIKRGDIIVFSFPAKDKKQINCGDAQYGRDFVKRVIGLPGDTVMVKNAEVYINGEKLPKEAYELYDAKTRYTFTGEDNPEIYQEAWEGRILEHYLGSVLRDDFGPVKVPEGSYFAMGDNRDHSCDSRFWGPVPRENIKGKAWFIHLPFSRIGFIK